MPILVDYSQVQMGALHANFKDQSEITEEVLAFMTMNMLRSYFVKFRKTYGEMILCIDHSRDYWRKDYYSDYKGDRAEKRDKDEKFDWDMIFKTFEKIQSDIKENFPFKVVSVNRCEADDVIATLTYLLAPTQKTIILSSDHDFKQLQVFKNVKQFSPTQDKFIHSAYPKKELKEKIIKGDKGDYIPNILSTADNFKFHIRQKSVTKKLLEELQDTDPQDMEYNYKEIDPTTKKKVDITKSLKKRFKQNELMIDLTKIPLQYKDDILEEYRNVKVAQNSKLFSYFVKTKQMKLLEDVNHFFLK